LTAGKCSPSKGLAAEREKEKSRKMKTTSGDSLPKKNPQKKGIPFYRFSRTPISPSHRSILNSCMNFERTIFIPFAIFLLLG